MQDHKIGTERLLLRPLMDKDYSLWKQAHLNHTEMANEFDLIPRKFSQLSQNHFQLILQRHGEQRKLGTEQNLSIILRHPKQMIGFLQIQNIVRQNYHSAQIGYYIYPQFWKMGYATEAIQSIINYCFKKLQLRRIEAYVPVVNIASTKVIEKCGFLKEGTSRSRVFINNQWLDVNIYSLINLEFEFKKVKKYES